LFIAFSSQEFRNGWKVDEFSIANECDVIAAIYFTKKPGEKRKHWNSKEKGNEKQRSKSIANNN